MFNAFTADIGTGLSTCMTKDGQTVITANIPMAGFRLTGLGAGSSAGHSLRYEQLFNSTSLTLIGHLLFSADATYDIGASGATRPRSIFASTNITIGAALSVGTTGSFGAGISATTGSFSAAVNATNFAPTGSSVPANGMFLPSASQVAWAVNSIERARMVASTTDNNGETMFQWTSIAGVTHIFQGVSNASFNAANTAFKLGEDNTTNRSLNAAGTVNASGADYAEYERKREDCGDIAKGAVVGFDTDGLLTDQWALAVTFGVKSTNPSYVGGDTWGREEDLGIAMPVMPDAPEEGEAEKYAEDMAQFKAILDSARAKVDRIAYAGKVPVNVIGAKPGQWIVPVQDGDGIGGKVSDTFDPEAVGRVRRILPDGRAEIAL